MATKPAAAAKAAETTAIARGPDRFKEALAHVLVHEGGKVDHPQDPGGRTAYGITQRVYSGWLAANGRQPADVFKITPTEVEQIYRKQFWGAIQGDALPPGVGYVVFDGAVNSGSKQSVKWLQRALGFAPKDVDGILGNVTLGALKANTDHDRLIAAICSRRMAFLQALKTWKTFGKGWSRRVNDVRKVGQALAMGSEGPAVEYSPGGDAKASIDEAKSPPPKMPGDIGIGGAGGVAMSGTALNAQLNEQLGPFAAVSWVAKLLPWVIGAAIVVAAAAALYRGYAKRKADALSDALDTEVA